MADGRPRLMVMVALGLVAGLSAARAQGPADNRCYLENGGSSDSYFVSEDLAVGSTVAQLRVHGDPRAGVGNIALRLQETDSPVDIPAGSRNLTLRRRLDKEGRDGPASVYVNVICERLHTNDPGFVIPVTIRVTDANDNAPRFLNAPYVLNISEVTVVGTRVLQGVRAVDDDQHGPFSTVRYSVVAGPHADVFAFENELEGTLVLRRPLDYELVRSFAVGLRAQDQGSPPRSADTELLVHVLDADDQNPRFLDERYTALLPEPATEGASLRVRPRDIAAYDQDEGIRAPVLYAFSSASAEHAPFAIGRETGRVVLRRAVEPHELLQPVTLVVRAVQQDNPDRYALATLTVSRAPVTDPRHLRFVQRVFHVTAPENLPAGSVLATLATNRPRQPLDFYVSEQALLDVFSIDAAGELSLRRSLDFELRDSYVFKVFVTDGVTNDSSVVNVSVANVNDWEPRFRYPQYEFFVGAEPGAAEPGQLVGRVEAADGDRGDVVRLSLAGPDADLFTVNALGEVRLRHALDKARAGPLHVTAVAEDSGRPPRRATVPVTVHVGARGPPPAWTGRGAGPLLAGLCAALLALLALVVAVLVLFVCKSKRAARRVKARAALHEKPPLATAAAVDAGADMENPVFGDATGTMGGATGDAYTATVKSIMCRNGTVRANAASRRISPKVHPAPSPPALVLGTATAAAVQNNLGDAARGPPWPATIPVRVKKLSWGDDSHTKTDSDSVENVNNIDTANLEPALRLTDTSNLTVYF